MIVLILVKQTLRTLEKQTKNIRSVRICVRLMWKCIAFSWSVGKLAISNDLHTEIPGCTVDVKAPQKRNLCVSVYDSKWQHYGQGTGSYFATNTRRPLKWGESSELESSIFFRLCSLFCLITCKDYGVWLERSELVLHKIFLTRSAIKLEVWMRSLYGHYMLEKRKYVIAFS